MKSQLASSLIYKSVRLLEGLEKPKQTRRLPDPGELYAERLHLDEKILGGHININARRGQEWTRGTSSASF